MLHRPLYVAVLLLAGASLPVSAQEASPAAQAAPKPAPEPAKPPGKPASKPGSQQVTSTPFGDWALRCQRNDSARRCEISQIIDSPDRSAPIAKISVGRPSPGAALHAVVLLPTNVSFPSAVHIRTQENDKWGVELDWRRCIPGACIAETTLSDATIGHWHGLSTLGSIVFTDAAGEEISLPMTFHGFGEALDALNKS